MTTAADTRPEGFKYPELDRPEWYVTRPRPVPLERYEAYDEAMERAARLTRITQPQIVAWVDEVDPVRKARLRARLDWLLRLRLKIIGEAVNSL